jgi:hypothetical protein
MFGDAPVVASYGGVRNGAEEGRANQLQVLVIKLVSQAVSVEGEGSSAVSSESGC